jgi:uncharacterized protein YcbX
MNVSAAWRYPVKSMGGETVDSCNVTERGLAGDRAWALIDPSTRKVGSAKSVKRFAGLLRCSATSNSAGTVRIELPDGRTIQTDQPDAVAVLTDMFGGPLELVPAAPAGTMVEFAAGTLGGKHAQTTELAVAGAAPAGALFDYACIHLVTTATLRGLAAAYPGGDFGVERFRPNFVVDCGDATGFVENGWVGRTLAIGDEVVLKVSMPCPRCVMPTLARLTLPHDPEILRTIARENRLDLGDFGHLPCTGVYADIVRTGRVTRGDAVRVVD